jgi:hypothetical protein
MRETLDRLKAQIAEMQRIYGENARDAGYLHGTVLPILDRQIRADALMSEELVELANVYPPWQVGESVVSGDLRSFDNMLWKVIDGKSHTTQSDWTPPVARSLWVRTAPPDVIPEWEQPFGSHDAYPINYKVTHNGNLYESLVAANVWVPGSDPTLWQIIQDEASEPTIPDWQPWDGHNENLYQVGDEVVYNGQHWIATVGNNHWTPGDYGWSLV